LPLDTTTIPDRHDRTGSKARKYFRATGPASYVTGGEAVDFGLSNVELVIPDPATNGTDLRLVAYDYTNKKLKWFDLAGAEIANGQSLAAYAVRLEAIGH
jgi:hypothetical protein